MNEYVTCKKCGHKHILATPDGTVVNRGTCEEFDPSLILKILKEKKSQENFYLDANGNLVIR